MWRSAHPNGVIVEHMSIPIRQKSKVFVLFLFLLVFFLNYKEIGRFFYPFPYRELVFSYANAYSIDPFLLVAVMKAESNFKTHATSEKGARGLMQIMPETGQWIAEKLGDENYSCEALFQPETSIKYGAWYIADLSGEFHGDPVLVLAAYNGGRGNVRDWLANHQIKSAGDIEEIPFPETRRYVKKVLLYYRIYRLLYA